ncbi:type VII secretion-associated protein [Mycobacterium sp. NPDC006124]|uniref:type VII secretion-associated protein n=1 Tax=Mycobacterium sp. NPDC006124 TaxID=3156729 RepID=UPI0033BF93C3
MSAVVVVVGPKEVLGPGVVEPELASTALASIDDDHALVEDRVVSVDELWREAVGSAIGSRCARLTLICPSWWSARRLARVATAGRHWCGAVTVLPRAEAWSAETIVELGPDLVVVHAGGRSHAIARAHHGEAIVDAVVDRLDGRSAVTVDAPSGLELLGANLVRVLRLRGGEVTLVDDRTLAAAVGSTGGRALRWPVSARTTGLAAAILVATGLVVAAVTVGGQSAEAPAAAAAVDVSWLVEGRVAVEVPSGWSVERITAGPGSARVQVISPDDGSAVIHLTQSRVPDAETLDSTATALASALAAQPDGTFVDFSAADERANRSAVTYREVRADRRVDWTVLLDGGVRIAIGCQGAGPVPRAACDRAIRSAHAIQRK